MKIYVLVYVNQDTFSMTGNYYYTHFDQDATWQKKTINIWIECKRNIEINEKNTKLYWMNTTNIEISEEHIREGSFSQVNLLIQWARESANNQYIKPY